MTKKAVPKLQQEVKVKVDIVTSDDIKIYCTGKFQDFTARYIIKIFNTFSPSPNLFIYQTTKLWNHQSEKICRRHNKCS